MNSTHILSALDVALVDAKASGLHFITFTEHGMAVCLLCSRLWNREAYAADTTRCPGYSACGQEARR